MHFFLISVSLTLSLCAAEKESVCDIPQKPEGGYVLLMQGGSDGKPPPGSIAIFTCDEDRDLVGASILKCLDDGYWTAQPPKCTETGCDIPLKPEHGSMHLDTSGEKIPIGSTVKFACDDGRILEGSSTSKCLENGQWNFPTPKCRRVELGVESLQSFKNGSSESSELLVTTKRHGPTSTPEHLPTDTSQTGCDIPLKPEHGSMFLYGCGEKPQTGSIAVFLCDDCRFLDGSPTSECLGNGQWTFPTPKCLSTDIF